jgi:hypothetical protein
MEGLRKITKSLQQDNLSPVQDLKLDFPVTKQYTSIGFSGSTAAIHLLLYRSHGKVPWMVGMMALSSDFCL